MKKWIKAIGIAILIGTFLGLFAGNLMIYTGVVDLLSTLQNKIDIYEIQREEQVKEITEFIKDIGTLAIENDIKQLELVENTQEIIAGVQDNMRGIVGVLKQMKEKLNLTKTIDVPNVKDIKGANVLVYNITKGITGSGIHIKINGKSYVLSCSHLIKDIEDDIVADIYSLTLVKYSPKEDLALYRFNYKPDLPYLEISNIAPTEGSEVLIVGNPGGLIDVVTDGTIAKTGNQYYIMTNKIYFGNSGGAILYRGKIIGVVTQFKIWFAFPVIVNHAYGCNLETLQEFLAEINE